MSGSGAEHPITISASLADGPPPNSAALLATMYAIRFFEDEIRDLFTQGLVRGSTHLYQGQEAVAVGALSVLRPDDTMTCTYRSHGATIAKGSPLDRCFAEILGRDGGLCAGKGGSMHFTDAAVGAIGSNAIVGAHLPITVGAALAAKVLGTGRVSIAFFGDGACNIGAFHESLNMAALWKLPAIFVIENNKYGEYSPVSATTAGERLVDRALAYGMPGVLVDGNDIVAMQTAVAQAAQRARDGEGPTLIEADTYRHSGHSRSDPAAYRPEGELESWLLKDPIPRLEQAMLAAGQASAELEAIRDDARQRVREARDRALSWPEPPLSALTEDVIG